MSKILDHLPIVPRDAAVLVRDETVRLKQAEIIVSVSLTAKSVVGWNPLTPIFPAILDTGHTHNFSIQEQQLIRWAGIRPDLLRVLGRIRQAGKRIPLHAANVWVHRNLPGERDLLGDEAPFLLKLPRGISIHPAPELYPRLPLLGLRAILSNNLYLAVDGERQHVTLRTPDWRTRLLRWLT
jgi:hypothetical protein